VVLQSDGSPHNRISKSSSASLTHHARTRSERTAQGQ
jgi:hypothetical protein